jgi:GNAT superfamily N-acetyltransferase
MEVIVRATADRDDEVGSLAIYNEVWPRAAVTMDEVDSYKASSVAFADHLALLDGEPIGSGAVAILPSRPDVGSASITVLARHRGRGAGTALYREISRWCAAQGVETIEAPMEVEDAASVDYARRHGFTEIERFGRMVLELGGVDVPVDPPPAGIEIVSWAERPELARGIYEVAVEAYPDMPGNEADEMEPYEAWLAHDMQGSADRPEATFVALSGDEVVGFAKFFLTAAQPADAHHDTTGVKRAWRGRGIALALKHAQIGWAKRQGYERLVTGNEMRNEPIRRLNARLGYREEPGRLVMRGPLLGG